MTRAYNTGTDADRRKALESIADLAKLEITLATGTVVLSATFLEDFYEGKRLNALLAGWSTLGLSVLLGLVVLGGCVSQLAESDVKPRRTYLEAVSLFQWAAFLTGIILFGLFAATNVAAK